MVDVEVPDADLKNKQFENVAKMCSSVTATWNKLCKVPGTVRKLAPADRRHGPSSGGSFEGRVQRKRVDWFFMQMSFI